jgi:hypothetical protein
MNDELLEQYKAMAKHGTMEERIDAHLKANCEKYDPTKLKDCVKHLVDVAREILDGKNGEVPDEVCFKICRDYFNDELWNVEEVKTKAEAAKIERKIQQAKFKKEKAAQAVKDAKAQEAKAKKEVKKAEKESSEFHRKEKRKYMEAMAKKVTQDFEKEQADKAREKLATNDTKKPVFESTPTPPNPIIKAVEEAKPCTKEQRVQHCEGQLDMFGLLFEGATA